jgi:hypothetical protein
MLEVEKSVLRSRLLAHLLICTALADMEGCVVLEDFKLVTGPEWQKLKRRGKPPELLHTILLSTGTISFLFGLSVRWPV